MDRVLALHAGSRGFDSRRRQMSERFFRSNRPGYPHPVSSELEKCGIRVAVSNCSVSERRRWRPPYQTGKTVHMNAKHYKHNEDGRTAPGVCGNGSVPLSHSGNVVTQTILCHFMFYSILFYPITLESRRGTTDEFATILFHLDLFSAALVELAKSIPVHSLILSSHLFFCLTLLLFLSLYPIGLSLLNQKTFRRGQTILVLLKREMK